MSDCCTPCCHAVALGLYLYMCVVCYFNYVPAEIARLFFWLSLNVWSQDFWASHCFLHANFYGREMIFGLLCIFHSWKILKSRLFVQIRVFKSVQNACTNNKNLLFMKTLLHSEVKGKLKKKLDEFDIQLWVFILFVIITLCTQVLRWLD